MLHVGKKSGHNFVAVGDAHERKLIENKHQKRTMPPTITEVFAPRTLFHATSAQRFLCDTGWCKLMV